MSAIRDADNIIVLNEATVREQGTHADLLAADGWYARLYRYQQIERVIDGFCMPQR